MTILQKHLVFIPLCLIVFGGLFGWIVMLLWNWLMPSMFGLAQVGFWQAVGLLALCKILFGSIGFGHHPHGRHCHHGKNKLREHWNNMTPEERKKVMEHYNSCNCDSDGLSQDEK